MIEYVLIGNAVLATVLIAAPFDKQRDAKIAVFVWSLLTTAFLYYLIWSQGASSPAIMWYGLSLPLVTLPVLVALILGLATEHGKWATARFVLMLAFVAMGVMWRNSTNSDLIIYRMGTAVDRIVSMMTLIVGFELCLLAPLTMFAGGGKGIALKLFPVNEAQFAKHLKILAGGFGFIVFVLMVTHLLTYGHILNISFTYTLSQLGVKAVLYVFYYVLINQFLSLAIMRRLMFLILGDERMFIAEILLYAGAYAFTSYFFPPVALVREFLMGLVFAYWYMKTGTLAYGLIVGSLVWLFFL